MPEYVFLVSGEEMVMVCGLKNHGIRRDGFLFFAFNYLMNGNIDP